MWDAKPGEVEETYLNLSPGTYCLSVWGVDSFSRPSPKPAQLWVKICQLERAAGGGRGTSGRRPVADGHPGERVLDEQEVRLRGPLDELEQVAHRRDLLALLLEEPVQELLADEVALLARERRRAR